MNMNKQFSLWRSEMEKAKRSDGTPFYRVKKDCDADDLNAVIRRVHGNYMPNDLIYEYFYDVLSCEFDDPEEPHEQLDGLVPIYYSDIRRVYGEEGALIGDYIAQAHDSGLLEGVSDIDKQIQVGIYCLYEEIYYALKAAWEDMEEEDESDD